mmetsp:Transcript_14935/g.44263  ORF Transcript_14935/g.44263 Transcript_14935/m.44263 type:complete len:323 (-) Transcript_14935:953-1921(-)
MLQSMSSSSSSGAFGHCSAEESPSSSTRPSQLLLVLASRSTPGGAPRSSPPMDDEVIEEAVTRAGLDSFPVERREPRCRSNELLWPLLDDAPGTTGATGEAAPRRVLDRGSDDDRVRGNRARWTLAETCCSAASKSPELFTSMKRHRRSSRSCEACFREMGSLSAGRGLVRPRPSENTARGSSFAWSFAGLEVGETANAGTSSRGVLVQCPGNVEIDVTGSASLALEPTPSSKLPPVAPEDGMGPELDVPGRAGADGQRFSDPWACFERNGGGNVRGDGLWLLPCTPCSTWFSDRPRSGEARSSSSRKRSRPAWKGQTSVDA